MSTPLALVISDNLSLSKSLEEKLELEQVSASIATSALEGIQELRQRFFPFIFCDFDLSTLSGLDVLQITRELHKDSLFVLLTNSSEKGLQSLRLGGFHYLMKPVSQEALTSCLREGKKHLPQKTSQGKVEQKKTIFIAESPQMRQLLQNIEKIAKSQASVFISGESGTGKEVLASTIHYLSTRAEEPFIRVNCSAIPETLLESEFFGHEKGAFTGADRKKLGRFELANNGTLLLDEITEVPAHTQPKLLRAIQEREFERVGGTKPIKVDVRIISTSNRDMAKALQEKSFRSDLFFRLHVIPIEIPPLRERPEDIIPLALHFLEKSCEENHIPLKHLSIEAKELLSSYPFPGNVRELSNIIERTVVMHIGKEISKSALQLEIPKPPAIVISSTGKTLAEIEKIHILKTLQELGENKTKAAKTLGISLRTLHNKLKEYSYTG